MPAKIKMNVGVIILLIFGVLLKFFCVNSNDTNDELVFAHTICRHGDRNIYPSYPNDPWKSEEYWPEGFGALTSIGKQQHYELGQYFRKRYEKLLGNGEYSDRKVNIFSTDTDRTLMSAAAAMAGLFPPQNNQIWNENLSWQLNQIHKEPKTQDTLLIPEKKCDRYDYEMMEFTNTAEYKLLLENNQPLITYLEENSGEKLNTVFKICYLYDKLFVEQLKGMKLPSWAEKVMIPGGDFESLVFLAYASVSRTTEMKKLRSGFLLAEILDRSTNKTKSILQPDRSLWMYFAHDITISNMLNSLGLLKMHIPPYASCIFFELYKTDADNYLQVFYKNSTETNIDPLEIPNCGTKCPLNKWYELYQDILPTKSYDEECRLSDGMILPLNGNPESFTI